MSKVLYNQAGCFFNRYTPFNESFEQIGDECSVKTSELFNQTFADSVRWTVFSVFSVFMMVSAWRFVALWKETPKIHRNLSIALAVTYRLVLLDLIGIVYCQDFSNAYELFPKWLSAIINGSEHCCFISIFVILVYGIWTRVLNELNQKSDLSQRQILAFFGQLILVSLFYSLVIKNSTFRAFQWLVMGIEVLFLGILNLWFGLKLFKQVRTIQLGLRSSDTYKPIIKKILYLLTFCSLAVLLLIGYYFYAANSLFAQSGKESQVFWTKEEINFSVWANNLCISASGLAINIGGIVAFLTPYSKRNQTIQTIQSSTKA